MIEQPFSSPDSYDSCYQAGKAQNDAKQYEQAVISFDRALKINSDTHEAWALRGSALFSLKQYKQSQVSYEKALVLQREAGDRRGAIGTLQALASLYSFNGKVQKSFSAIQQASEIASELNLLPDDPLYSPELKEAGLPVASRPPAISALNKRYWMETLVRFGMKGKLQFGLFSIVWLLLAIGTIAVSPITFFWQVFRKLAKQD
ncbi:hypothetical protein [Altericista sp. CCNU0014]|uniref:hypothetical protein n=1 Tax=Altericista sp. CCNU0014 TaxID=3082949 RepID=UPI0038512AF3